MSVNHKQRYEQRKLIAKALEMSYAPPVEGSAADYGWSCAANLVQHWLENPDSVPQPPAEPLRGAVFIEADGTIRKLTYRDMQNL